MSQGAAVIQVRDLRKSYGEGATTVHALRGVNLTIRAGEFVSVMGSSGSGKSTCMNILGCLDTPTSGQYLFHGVDVAGLNRDQLALLRRHYLGFVFQSFNLLPRTTALENVMLPLVYRGIKRARRPGLALQALQRVGLGDRADHTPAQLSGGQQQRVAIARALVTSPEVLLADEPTGNLDTARTAEIMRLLQELNRETGVTIVMVTHEPEVAHFTSRVVMFRDGDIIDDGTPAQVLDS